MLSLLFCAPFITAFTALNASVGARRLADAVVLCGGAQVTFPDVDHGLSCGDCKVLADNFNSVYGSCDEYCLTMGRRCVYAAEEQSDDCNVKCAMTPSIPDPSPDHFGAATHAGRRRPWRRYHEL